jgi:hypothetical protein
MRKRSREKLEENFRAKLLDSATRLLSTAEEQAAKGKPQLFRAIARLSAAAEPREADQNAPRTAPPESQEELDDQLRGLIPDAIEQAKKGKPALLRALELVPEPGDEEPQRVEIDFNIPRPNREKPPDGERSPENSGDRE